MYKANYLIKLLKNFIITIIIKNKKVQKIDNDNIHKVKKI